MRRLPVLVGYPTTCMFAVLSRPGGVIAAARALLKNTNLPAEKIVEEALHIAASICVYTNENISVESL